MIYANTQTGQGVHQVQAPDGSFVSCRMILKAHGTGYTITETHVRKGGPYRWKYSNHIESCYCVYGEAILSVGGKDYRISPGALYCLDKNEEHLFYAHEDTKLVCVFNPPLNGDELHNENGEYEL